MNGYIILDLCNRYGVSSGAVTVDYVFWEQAQPHLLGAPAYAGQAATDDSGTASAVIPTALSPGDVGYIAISDGTNYHSGPITVY